MPEFSIKKLISEDREAFLWLLVLPLSLALPCFLGWAWAEGDLVRQFYPWKSLLQQALQSRSLPLWNPYVYCGMPLLANFQSAFFCLNQIPFLFLPFVPSLGLHLLFDFFWSGLGFYAFSRAFGLSRGSALLAALCWQANAFLLARVEFMSALSAYSWSPWILWAVLSSRPLWLLALFVGLQALCGYPLELAYGFLASLALAFFYGEGRLNRTLWAWALGLSLGAVQVLPGLELLAHSSRLHGGLSGSLRGELHFSDLEAWVFPFTRQAWTAAFSISIPSLILVFLARGKAALYAFGLLALGMLLAWGVAASYLPNRHPSLALIYVSCALALLTGMGAERYLAFFARKAFQLCYVLVLLEGVLPWYLRGDLVQASLYQPSQAAAFMAPRLGEQARIFLSPEVQLEVDRSGPSASQSWSCFGDWLQANTSTVSGIHDANGYDPLQPKAIVPILDAVSFPRMDWSSPWLPLLGVGAAVTWDPKAGRFHAAIRKLETQPLRAILLGQDDASYLRLDQPMEPGDLKESELVHFESLSKKYPLRYAEDGWNRVQVDLPETHPAGYLFVNDTAYPGWSAEIDGQAVPMHQALGAFRAVEISAQAQHLTMRYRPLSVLLGSILSLLSLSLICLLIFQDSKRGPIRAWSPA